MQEQHVQNLAKMGGIPGWPTYPPWLFKLNFGQSVHECICKPIQYVLCKILKISTKVLNHDKMGPSAEAGLRTKSQTDLRRNIQALIDMSVQQTAKT